MIYTHEQREIDIEKINQELRKMRTSKGNDYGDTDTLANMRLFGWKGVIVRLGDKMMRLRSFFNKGYFDIQDESVEDTFADIINYCYYGLMLWRWEKKMKECGCKPTASYVDENPSCQKSAGRGKVIDYCAENVTIDSVDVQTTQNGKQ